MRTKITMLILVCLTILSCSKDNEEINVQGTFENAGIDSRRIDIDNEPNACEVIDLIAAQNYVCGTVTISRDTDYVMVTYTTVGDWTLEASHLFVGGCEDRPQNNPGNPLIGQFPYADTHVAGTTTHTYYLDALTTPLSGCIAAHAVVVNASGSETAWAAGLPYGGNSWATYSEYDITECIF